MRSPPNRWPGPRVCPGSVRRAATAHQRTGGANHQGHEEHQEDVADWDHGMHGPHRKRRFRCRGVRHPSADRPRRRQRTQGAKDKQNQNQSRKRKRRPSWVTRDSRSKGPADRHGEKCNVRTAVRQSPTARYPLPTGNRPLATDHCRLPTPRSPLLTGNWQLATASMNSRSANAGGVSSIFGRERMLVVSVQFLGEKVS